MYFFGWEVASGQRLRGNLETGMVKGSWTASTGSGPRKPTRYQDEWYPKKDFLQDKNFLLTATTNDVRWREGGGSQGGRLGEGGRATSSG